jgi:hypothetical protein
MSLIRIVFLQAGIFLALGFFTLQSQTTVESWTPESMVDLPVAGSPGNFA